MQPAESGYACYASPAPPTEEGDQHAKNSDYPLRLETGGQLHQTATLERLSKSALSLVSRPGRGKSGRCIKWDIRSARARRGEKRAARGGSGGVRRAKQCFAFATHPVALDATDGGAGALTDSANVLHMFQSKEHCYEDRRYQGRRGRHLGSPRPQQPNVPARDPQGSAGRRAVHDRCDRGGIRVDPAFGRVMWRATRSARQRSPACSRRRHGCTRSRHPAIAATPASSIHMRCGGGSIAPAGIRACPLQPGASTAASAGKSIVARYVRLSSSLSRKARLYTCRCRAITNGSGR